MRARRYPGQRPAGLLAADPPWPFGDKLPGEGRGAGKNYSLLTFEQIRSYPLPPLADDCALFLWRVSSMVEEAYSVVRAWGFVPKSELVWNKMKKCGKCDGLGHRWSRGRGSRLLQTVERCEACSGTGERRHFGMGRTVRNCHEVAIVATRGRPVRLDGGVRSTFDALVPTDERGRVIHSAKPDAFYSIAAKLYGGPRVELFSRQPRDGWAAYGNETGKRRLA